jgi:hypothetical protein
MQLCLTSGFGDVPIAVQLNPKVLGLGHHCHSSAAAAGRRQGPPAPARPGTAVPKHHRLTLGGVHQQPVLPTLIAVAIDQLLQLLRRLAAQARVVSVSQVNDLGWRRAAVAGRGANGHARARARLA